jgi:hypothetical protein
MINICFGGVRIQKSASLLTGPIKQRLWVQHEVITSLQRRKQRLSQKFRHSQIIWAMSSWVRGFHFVNPEAQLNFLFYFLMWVFNCVL